MHLVTALFVRRKHGLLLLEMHNTKSVSFAALFYRFKANMAD